LAVSAGSISRSLAGLSGCESSKDLSGALAKLSDVQRIMENIHTKQVNTHLTKSSIKVSFSQKKLQASADYYLLSELIRDYIGLVGAVKDAFQVISLNLVKEKPSQTIFFESRRG